MKKIILVTLFLAIILGFREIHAAEPANKNLLNPETLSVSLVENTVISNATIAVEAGKTYTFSMPAQIGDVNVKIQSELKFDTYVNESANSSVICEVEWFTRSCTFTSENDTLIFEFHGGDIARQIDTYGFDGFQLEAGTLATDYIPYESLETTPPVFSGEGTLVLGYDQPTPTTTLISNHISATDEVDGDLSASIVILSDAYKGNETVLGVYPVELYVEDASGNGATFTMNVHVVDTLAPFIEAPASIDINVDTPSTVDEIISSNALLNDGYDGVIEGYKVITDTYTGNENVLGESTITFEIKDTSNNTTQHTFTINTVDTKAPVIKGPLELTLMLSDMKTPEDLLAHYTVSDNHTQNTMITLQVATHTMPIDEESGIYTMTLSALDESGNETILTVEITVKDDIPPKLRSFTYAKQSYKEPFDLPGYIELMEVSDNETVLSHLDIIVTNNTYQSDTIGKYTVTFEVKDAALNTTTHELTIDVVDDIAPAFIFTDSIQTTTTTMLNETQLNQLMYESKEMEGFDAVNYKVLDNTYKDNASNEGTYVYTVEFLNAEGETLTTSMDIEVQDFNASYEDTTRPIIPWIIIMSGGMITTVILVLKKRK